MSQSAIRYAAALGDTLQALPAAEADALLAQGHALGRLTGDDQGELFRFFASPAFTPAEKETIARELARRMGLAPMLCDLLVLLATNRRTAELGAIVASAERLHHRRQGIVDVELHTADPLTDAELDGLRPTLINLFGERLHITRTVDRALLGGLVVRTGTLLHDASLAGQIRRLHTYLHRGERHDA